LSCFSCKFSIYAALEFNKGNWLHLQNFDCTSQERKKERKKERIRMNLEKEKRKKKKKKKKEREAYSKQFLRKGHIFHKSFSTNRED
jgi:hypothetical protein